MNLSKLSNDILKLQQDFFDQINDLKTTKSTQEKAKLIDYLKPVITSYNYVKSIDFGLIEIDENLPKIIVYLLEKLFPKYFEIFQTSNKQSENDELEIFLIKIYFQIIQQITADLNYSTFVSLKFCNKFLENNGLMILFKYLTNQNLLNAYQNSSKNKNNKEFEQLDSIFRGVIGSLVCLARAYSNYKNKWEEVNAVKNFLIYLNNTKNIRDNKIYACLAIAFVANDQDIEQLPELKEMLPDITKMIGLAAKFIKENENLNRIEVQLDDSTNEIKEVCSVHYMDTQWSLLNLLKALYHLSVNDKIKYDIYYKNSINKHLRSIIYNGNDVEAEYCLMLLWQLCFDKQIASDVLEDTIFYDFILNLSNDSDPKRRNLVKNASGIIWLLNKSNDENNIEQSKPEQKPMKSTLIKSNEPINVEKINQKHIMISYNRESRDLCLKIKNELEQEGLKIWIDTEDIHGSSLESMANAIENSVCVLMCMTEKYKQSVNCRAEAEYSFQLNKPIIPLIMQKDYKPDGWLGIILGSKIFVHFMKYDFDECIRRLKAELQVIYRDNKIKAEIIELWKTEPDTIKQDSNQLSVIKDKTVQNEEEKIRLNLKATNWDEAKVSRWLIEKNIHENIINKIKPCDGRLLFELYLIKKETPEFFFKSLSKSEKSSKKNLMLKDIALFSSELKHLFQSY